MCDSLEKFIMPSPLFKISNNSSVGRVSACMVSPCEQRHDRFQFQAPPMPARRYMEENGLAAMLVTKRSADVTPEVNLMECIMHKPLPRANKAANSGFEPHRRHHLKQGYH